MRPDIPDARRRRRCVGFLEERALRQWDDFKKAYVALYKPLLLRFTFPFPNPLLHLFRIGYRRFRRKGGRARTENAKGRGRE